MAYTQLQHFVQNRQDLDEALVGAKQMACPHCRRMGMVVGHGLLRGYAESGQERVVRGRRLLCSRRLRRSGCGRTFSVLLATVLAGFVVRTGILSRLLEAVVGGGSRKAAWECIAPALTLRSGYRLWARLLDAQTKIRTALCDLGPPPATTDTRPIAQVLAHLKHLFAGADTFSEFQFTCQRTLFR